ncbi:FtsX-like permease family protein [Streptomyces sp. NPDC093598]|uniref:FtsX-like permease family protein n=1 Tax=Streptomyces sp. NPDC093598 TaxID=3366046 RepID=UPI003824054A
MMGFAFKTLRHRKAAFVGAFVTLLCAAALITGCGMLLETGLRGTVEPERYAAAPVVVAGDQYVHQTITKKKDKKKHKAKQIAERRWIPSSLADALRELPGVREVVSEVTFPVYGDDGRKALGHGWNSASLTPFTLADGRAPKAADEVVVDAASGQRVGGRLKAVTPAGPASYTVVGVTAQHLSSQRTVFFSPAQAERLAGRPGQVTAIGVFPNDGDASAVDVSKVVGTSRGVLSYVGQDRGKAEFYDAEQARIKLISLGGALGGTALLVAVLVVVGTFTLSVQQRQREIALLRAVAATPKQLRRLLGGEALLVAAAASVCGAAAGLGLGFWLRARFVALGAMPEQLKLVVSPFPAAAAVLATLVAAWAAARLTARRAARIRPVEALGEAAMPTARLPWTRLLAGAVVTAGAVTLTIVLSTLTTEAASGPLTMVTALLWTVAVALLGPLLVRAAVALLGIALRTSRTSGYLAAANLRTRARRLASVVVPLTLMIGVTCTILFVPTTMGHAAQAEAAAGNRADYVLGPHIPASSAAQLRSTDGVVAVTEVLHTNVRVGLTKYGAQGVTPHGLDRTSDLGVTAGSLNRLGPGTLAVSENAADRLGVGVGGTVKMTLGDGTPVRLKVIAMYARGLGFGELTLDHGLLARHVDDPTGTLLVAASGLDRMELAAALPGARVMDRAEAVEAAAPDAEVNYFAMGLVIAFTAIAVVNTLAMSTADRTRELALLRLVGTTRRQILRMLRLETLTALTIAAVLGTALSVATLTAFSSGMTGTAAPHIPLTTYASVLAAAAALALTATALPARAALRQRATEAVGRE